MRHRVRVFVLAEEGNTLLNTTLDAEGRSSDLARLDSQNSGALEGGHFALQKLVQAEQSDQCQWVTTYSTHVDSFSHLVSCLDVVMIKHTSHENNTGC